MPLTDLVDNTVDIVIPPEPIGGEYNDVQGTATLQDLVYFGAAWPGLDIFAYGIHLRDGWTNATIYRTETAEASLTGGFFAGQVERVDANGKVTDVVLSFQGMQVDATVLVGAAGAILGVPTGHVLRGIELFDAIMHDPRYVDAKIHITGYSLGTHNASWILAHSIATYGEAITDQRVDFTSFAPARYHDEGIAWYGLSEEVFDGRWTNYQAANDENRPPDRELPINPYDYVGTEVILPALNTETGAADVHLWNHLAIALGLPDWLTPDEKQFVYDNAGTKSAAGYTTPGLANLIIEGDDAGTTLTGLGADDVIGGGLGQDTLVGNGGNDTFKFDTIQDSGWTAGTADRIMDFNEGDRIDLSLIDAVQLFQLTTPDDGVNETFSFIGSGNFTGAGQVRSWIDKKANVTYVAGNTDNDSTPEFMIVLQGQHRLDAGDFVL